MFLLFLVTKPQIREVYSLFCDQTTGQRKFIVASLWPTPFVLTGLRTTPFHVPCDCPYLVQLSASIGRLEVSNPRISLAKSPIRNLRI